MSVQFIHIIKREISTGLLSLIFLISLLSCRVQNLDFASKHVWTVKVAKTESPKLKKQFDGLKIYRNVVTPIFDLGSGHKLSVLFKNKKMKWSFIDSTGRKVPPETITELRCVSQYNRCLSNCGDSINQGVWFCNIKCGALYVMCTHGKLEYSLGRSYRQITIE